MGMVSHPKWRCDTCEFWAHGDQRGEDYDADWHADDKIGCCRRNAPPASHGHFEYELLHLVTLLAPNDVDEKEFADWEEVASQFSSWPSTVGADWCGEWKERTRT